MPFVVSQPRNTFSRFLGCQCLTLPLYPFIYLSLIEPSGKPSHVVPGVTLSYAHFGETTAFFLYENHRSCGILVTGSTDIRFHLSYSDGEDKDHDQGKDALALPDRTIDH